MLLTQAIIEAKDTAGRANKVARDLGTKLREAEEKKESTGELQVQFDAALTDATSALTVLQRLQQEQELETQATDIAAMPTGVPARGGPTEGADTPVTYEAFKVSMSREERMVARRQLQTRVRQVERFAKAGVKTDADFRNFVEAHERAFVPYVLGGYKLASPVFEQFGFGRSEAMALLTSTGELVGFLVPPDFRAEVLEDMAGFAVMRSMCRIVPPRVTKSRSRPSRARRPTRTSTRPATRARGRPRATSPVAPCRRSRISPRSARRPSRSIAGRRMPSRSPSS